jgi:hypothetical protein
VENFPIIESFQTFFFLLFGFAGIVSIASDIKAWTQLTRFWRMAPFFAPLVFVTLYSLDRFGTPKVEIETTYIGSLPSVMVDITFGFGAVGNVVVKKGESWTTDMGRATPNLTIGWGATFEEKRVRRKEFFVGNQIPRFGSDRIIGITLRDDGASIRVDRK